MYKVGITGGRHYWDRSRVHGALDIMHEIHLDDMFLVVGCASGADELGRDWASSNLKDDHWKEFKADWDMYGKAAGCIRNGVMVDQEIDFLLVFPGGRGTADMLRQYQRYMKKSGKGRYYEFEKEERPCGDVSVLSFIET
jgi:hypothetical protein